MMAIVKDGDLVKETTTTEEIKYWDKAGLDREKAALLIQVSDVDEKLDLLK